MFKKGDIVVYKKKVLESNFIAGFVKEMYKNGDKMLILEDQTGEGARVEALSGTEKGDRWNSQANRLELFEPTGLEGATKLI